MPVHNNYESNRPILLNIVSPHQQHEARAYSRFWHRPARIVAVLAGIAGAIISLWLERRGIRWKYSEVGFGTVMLLWLLITGFRPAWSRLRFWMVMTAITAVHLAVWISLANKFDRFRFGVMFVLLVAELVLGASLIAKAIPEDEQVMLDYIARW
jgi:hypothetical protein